MLSRPRRRQTKISILACAVIKSSPGKHRAAFSWSFPSSFLMDLPNPASNPSTSLLHTHRHASPTVVSTGAAVAAENPATATVVTVDVTAAPVLAAIPTTVPAWLETMGTVAFCSTCPASAVVRSGRLGCSQQLAAGFRHGDQPANLLAADECPGCTRSKSARSY